MFLQIATIMVSFCVGVLCEHFRGRSLISAAIDKLESETEDMRAAMDEFDRRRAAIRPVPGQEGML